MNWVTVLASIFVGGLLLSCDDEDCDYDTTRCAGNNVEKCESDQVPIFGTGRWHIVEECKKCTEVPYPRCSESK